LLTSLEQTCFFLVFNVPVTVNNTNVSAYTESPIKEQIEAHAASLRAKIFNPNYTQIGENINIIRTVFQNSKDAGKPWQIWAGGTSKYYLTLRHHRKMICSIVPYSELFQPFSISDGASYSTKP
jgi:hypothetical protein